jgi:hypothetical protein
MAPLERYDSNVSYDQNYEKSAAQLGASSIIRHQRQQQHAALTLPGPADPGTGMVQCFVKRSKAGGLLPSGKRTYDLCSKTGTKLATTMAHGGATETSYVINGGDSAEDERVGKLKFHSKTEFQLLDGGVNLKKLSWEEREELDRGQLNPRTELCTITHSTNSASGTRFIRVVLPSGTVLVSKSPSWDPALKHSKLDFQGRVTMPSTKNFQLVEDGEATQRVVMQFGRVGKEAFNLDYMAPLSALQAFGIVLTVFRAGIH